MFPVVISFKLHSRYIYLYIVIVAIVSQKSEDCSFTGQLKYVFRPQERKNCQINDNALGSFVVK